jgi:alpha-methylacyl-CoA racemase
VAAALVEAQRSGKGQVVDAAMVEGASLLAAMFAGLLKDGQWNETRGDNILDTGAPWYNVYETKDGKHVSIGSIEARFFDELLEKLQIDKSRIAPQHDRGRWPEMKALFARQFKAKTREEWCRVFEGSDACFAPVLSFSEARRDAHNRARQSFVSIGGVEQPAPAPRFSRTPPAVRAAPPERGEGGRAALADWGFSAKEAETLECRGLGTKE